LENEPVYATLGDEEIRLEHLDVTKDIPRTTTFLRVLDLSKEPQDWQNIPALLEGFHRSHANIPHAWFEKLIRKANEARMLGVVIRCLEQVERNGFSLNIPIVRESVLLGIRKNAKDAERVGNLTEKSLKQAQTVLELMEKPAHCGSRTVSDLDPRAEPYVIGIPLELAAMRAKNPIDGSYATTSPFARTAPQDMVSLYANRLIVALGQQQTDLSSDSAWQALDPENKDALRELDWLVRKYMPVRNGLKLAQEILGSSLPEEARVAAEKYQELIERRLDDAASSAKQLQDTMQAPCTTDGLEEWAKCRASMTS